MEHLRPFFSKSHGKDRVYDCHVLSGIIFVNRNGLRWRDAPREYGPHKTLYNRWKRWGAMGFFARMMDGLETKGIKPCIPGWRSRGGPARYDRRKYKRRNRIQIMLSRLKDWRWAQPATTDV
nr:transposase [Gluconobacter oxydans]